MSNALDKSKIVFRQKLVDDQYQKWTHQRASIAIREVECWNDHDNESQKKKEKKCLVNKDFASSSVLKRTLLNSSFS